MLSTNIGDYSFFRKGAEEGVVNACAIVFVLPKPMIFGKPLARAEHCHVRRRDETLEGSVHRHRPRDGDLRSQLGATFAEQGVA